MKPSYQISDLYPVSKWQAGNGNDGVADTNALNGFCAITRIHASPWWEVDLLDVYCISEINITNRGDCCGM